MIQFQMLDPRMTTAHLGLLPEFFNPLDPRPAKEQIDQNYAHGGGWSPMAGFKFDVVSLKLSYPGDPPMRPLAWAKLRDELIIFYDHSWLAIVQPDGSYEVSRVD